MQKSECYQGGHQLSILPRNELESFSILIFLNLLQISHEPQFRGGLYAGSSITWAGNVSITIQEVDMPHIAQLGVYHQKKGTRLTNLSGTEQNVRYSWVFVVVKTSL